MTIASEIQRLQQAKSDLKSSIENKGVTVASTTKLDGYASLVDSISSGGFTCTLTNAGNVNNAYITYNGTKYYSSHSSFTFQAGDTITIYLANSTRNYISEGDYTPTYQTTDILEYEYSLPSADVSITFAMATTWYKVTISQISVPTYYPVYRVMAMDSDSYDPVITPSTPNVSQWFANLPWIKNGQFAQSNFSSGTYTFQTASSIGAAAFGCLVSPTGNNVIFNFPLVTKVSFSAFYSRTGLTQVSLPECTVIDTQAFYSCRSLQSISCPKCSSVGTSAFAYCTSLSTVNFSICTTIKSYAFLYCSKITSISFPECTTIEANAFQYCYSLPVASFPECTTISASAFASCSSLTTISFPKCTSVGSSAFVSCSQLTEANLPECTTLGTYAFRNCSNLASISFPKCTVVPSQAFGYCTNSLSFVSLSLVSIVYSSAFQGCQQLQEVKLSACTSIGDMAFASCWNLISLNLTGISSVPTLGAVRALQSTPISNYSTVAGQYGSIYVPSSLYTAFQTATNWSTYAARIVSV